MSRRRARTKRNHGSDVVKVDIWRSIAVLIEGSDEVSPDALKILAVYLAEATGIDDGPESLVSTLRELYRKGLLGIEDGKAYAGRPGRDAFGRVACVRDDSSFGQVDTPFGVKASSGAYHYDGGTLIPTAWLHDRRLSTGARGLLMRLASYRDHELPTELDLVGADDTETVRGYLGELDRVGYLVRHSDGRLGIRNPGGAA